MQHLLVFCEFHLGVNAEYVALHITLSSGVVSHFSVFCESHLVMHARALQFTFSGREFAEAPNAVHPQCFHVFFHAPTAPTAHKFIARTIYNNTTSLIGNAQPLQPPVLHFVPAPINPRMHTSGYSLSIERRFVARLWWRRQSSACDATVGARERQRERPRLPRD